MAVAVTMALHGQSQAVTLFEQGRIEQLGENYYRAVELYKQSLGQNPSYIEPMIGLAESFNALGQYDEALRYALAARRYGRYNLSLLNLEARVRTGMGDPDAARELFEQVIAREPYNIEARFGIAELDLADGRKRRAALQYLETLRASPNNVHALLSLALLHEELGEEGAASAYLARALESYVDDAQVQLAAAGYYAKKGTYPAAENYLATALLLKPGFPEALQLLADVYLVQDKVAEAIEVLQKLLASQNTGRLKTSQKADRLHRTRHSLGLAYTLSGQIAEALNSYNEALRLKPDDEVTRIAAENLSLRFPEKSDSYRRRFARDHLGFGESFAARNHLGKALLEFRRSILLDDELIEARLAYADIHRILGFPRKYLAELNVIKRYYPDYATSDVTDDIEIYAGRLGGRVWDQWANRLDSAREGDIRFNQYSIDKNAYSLAVFHLPARGSMVHLFAERELTLFVEDLLYRKAALSIADGDSGVQSFDVAFEEARSRSADFFLTITYRETERSLEIDGVLYLTRTGSELKRFAVFRTGNRRVADGLARFADQIAESFPPKGTLLAREFDEGLINLGKIDGLEQGQTLLIIKKGRLLYRSDEISFRYQEEDVLGRLELTRVDENIAEGTIVPASFFDRINPGDELIVFEGEGEGEGENEPR